jgi:hypothetical protein
MTYKLSYTEDGGRRFLQNTDTLLADYTVTHTRKHHYSVAPTMSDKNNETILKGHCASSIKMTMP